MSSSWNHFLVSISNIHFTCNHDNCVCTPTHTYLPLSLLVEKFPFLLLRETDVHQNLSFWEKYLTLSCISYMLTMKVLWMFPVLELLIKPSLIITNILTIVITYNGKFVDADSGEYSSRAKIRLYSNTLFWSSHSFKLEEGRSLGILGKKLYTFTEVKWNLSWY